MDNIIGIDIGTTHCKLIVVSKKNEVVFSAKRSCQSFTDETGKHEQDAEEISGLVIALLKEAFEHTAPATIACVSFSVAMHSFLAVDENGKPLMNALTWADTRAAKQAKQLKQSGKAASIYKQTGTPIHAMSPLCKLLWLKEVNPGAFNSAYKFISIKEYVFFRLFGNYVIDYSIASATGLFNIHNRKWNEDSLKAAGINKNQLSRLVDVYHEEARLLDGIKKQMGLSQNVPFIMGCSDGSAAQLGSGALLPTEVCITVGTSGAVRSFIQQPLTSPKEKTFTYLLQDGWYLNGGPTNNGGIALQWCAKLLLHDGKSDDSYERIISMAKESCAGSKGLLFVPYLYGERAPVWDADATGRFEGIRNIHTTCDFARAVIEGIMLNLFEIFQSLPNHTTVETVYANGGFFNNSFLAQMLADIFGIKVLLQKDADSSVMGAVYLGMLHKGWIEKIKGIKQLITTDKTFTPDEKNTALYKGVFQAYTKIRA